MIVDSRVCAPDPSCEVDAIRQTERLILRGDRNNGVISRYRGGYLGRGDGDRTRSTNPSDDHPALVGRPLTGILRGAAARVPVMDRLRLDQRRLAAGRTELHCSYDRSRHRRCGSATTAPGTPAASGRIGRPTLTLQTALLASPIHRFVGRPADGPAPPLPGDLAGEIHIRAGLGIVGDRYFGKPAHRDSSVWNQVDRAGDPQPGEHHRQFRLAWHPWIGAKATDRAVAVRDERGQVARDAGRQTSGEHEQQCPGPTRSVR